MKNSFIIILAFTLFSCQTKSQEVKKAKQIITETAAKTDKVAVFAEGCFWCAEHVFEAIPGVSKVTSGFAGGKEKDPTYEQVGRHETGHAEAVEVYYNPEIVSFEELVQVFFDSHDPTTLNRQGPDEGESYRSVAFFSNDVEKAIIDKKIAELTKNKAFDDPIVTEVKKLDQFYPAEDYHQNYVKLNPNQGYVKGVSLPRYEAFLKKYKGKIKS